MGLNTIAQVLEKRGRGYVEKVLEGNLVITEKLDTFRILFEMKDGELKFYKKNNTPITLIERTLTDIWENALIEIPTLVGETKLPEGIVFGLAYTPVERPLRLPYTNLPRYILTDMTKRNEGKIVETYDYAEVTEWAGILCMGRPPILFEGELSDQQRDLLIAYDTKQYNGEFDTFSEMINKTLKSSYSKEDIIEGVVIKSGKNLFQVVSYEFDLLNEAYKKQHTSRDFYDIVLLSLTEFMNSYKFPKLKSEKLDECYIEIVSDIFVKYCEMENISEGLDATYLQSPQYGGLGALNTKHIKNKKALEIIGSSPIHEALYRVFLSSFRKYKKPYGLLGESTIEKFNTFVGVINNMISEEVEVADYVNDYIGAMDKKFGKLNESGSKNITVKALKRRKPTETDNMRVIASVQNAFLPQPRVLNQGDKRVAVYVTSFMPFTNAQMTNIEQMHNQWNVPVVVAAVSRKREIKGKNFHVSDGVVSTQMRSLSNFNRNLIPSFMMLETWSLKEIYECLRPHYEPLVIFTDSGKESELSLQLFYEEEIMGGRINALEELNIGGMANKDAIPAYRAIEDGNGSLFMEITPKAIHNSYDSIMNEYRTWEGAIPAQFEPIIYPEIK